MKVAICSTGDTLDSPLDPRFGRCAFFIIADSENLEFTAVPNTGAQSSQGAGIEAAKCVASAGVSTVITGNLGPNAQRSLAAGNIKAYQGSGGSVREAIQLLNAGSLKEITDSTVPSHFGSGGGQGRNRQ